MACLMSLKAVCDLKLWPPSGLPLNGFALITSRDIIISAQCISCDSMGVSPPFTLVPLWGFTLPWESLSKWDLCKSTPLYQMLWGEKWMCVFFYHFFCNQKRGKASYLPHKVTSAGFLSKTSYTCPKNNSSSPRKQKTQSWLYEKKN